MSGSHTASRDIPRSNFYKLVSDIKDEISNSYDERDISIGGSQEQQKQHAGYSNSKLELVEFNPGISQTETPSVDDEIDIKYEVNDIHLNPTHDADDDLILDKMNPMTVNHESANSEGKELTEFYSDLLQCERDCLTCQDFIRKLSEHVRASHATIDPLHIDSLDADKSTSIENKPEIDGDIERMDSSEENDSNFESEVESSSDSDPDYNTSAESHRKRKSGQKLPQKKCSRKDEMVCQLKPKIHNGEKPFNCGICARGFTQNYLLTVHLRRHTGEKRFTCDDCGKSFERKDNLAVHISVHTGEKPFKCAHCTKCFRTKTTLNVHTRSHTGERPFNCEDCGKGFRTSSQLGIHRKSHNEGRSYKCDMCDKDFKRPDTLYKHKKKNCRNNI